MPTAKSTWFFIQGSKGWSLSLWKTFAVGQLDRTQGTALAAAPFWAALTGNETKLHAVRTSDEAVTGDSILEEVSFKGNDQTDSEDPNTTMVIRMQTQDRARKKNIFMRGIFDNLIVGGGRKSTLSVQWDKDFRALVDFLITNNYGWVGRDATTLTNITNYVSDANGIVTFTLDGNLFLAGDIGKRKPVRISGLNNSNSILNGQQVVIVTAQNGMKTFRGFGVGPFTGIGRARYTTKDLVIPSLITLGRVGERKAGAPFLQQVGRRPNRKLR